MQYLQRNADFCNIFQKKWKFCLVKIGSEGVKQM